MAEPICYCGAITQEECDAKVAEEIAFLSGLMTTPEATDGKAEATTASGSEEKRR